MSPSVISGRSARRRASSPDRSAGMTVSTPGASRRKPVGSTAEAGRLAATAEATATRAAIPIRRKARRSLATTLVGASLTGRGAPEVVVVGVSSAAGGRLAISRVPRVPSLSPRRYGNPDFSCENTDNRPSRHIFSCFPIQPRSSCRSSGGAVQKLASPAITCRMTLRMRRGRRPLGGTIAAHDA